MLLQATPSDSNTGISPMTDKPKTTDKPKDPPYSGGEDEETSNPAVKEPPVDESDEGPSG
jgi:hypothetical protein